MYRMIFQVGLPGTHDPSSTALVGNAIDKQEARQRARRVGSALGRMRPESGRVVMHRIFGQNGNYCVVKMKRTFSEKLK